MYKLKKTRDGNKVQSEHERVTLDVDGFAQTPDKICNVQQQMHKKIEYLYDDIRKIKPKTEE